LEFRGRGGIVVIPPSVHRSGRRYAWALGQSPDDVSLPALPAEVLDALRPPRQSAARPTGGQAGAPPAGIDASPRTLRFLAGADRDGPRWNDRLFAAACDLYGRGLAVEVAEPLLLAGARPWNRGEEEQAARTIRSAFSQNRMPALH
jgi:hypothetical protein